MKRQVFYPCATSAGWGIVSSWTIGNYFLHSHIDVYWMKSTWSTGHRQRFDLDWVGKFSHPFESDETAQIKTCYITLFITVVHPSCYTFSLRFEFSRSTHAQHSKGGFFRMHAWSSSIPCLWTVMYWEKNCLPQKLIIEMKERVNICREKHKQIEINNSNIKIGIGIVRKGWLYVAGPINWPNNS